MKSASLKRCTHAVAAFLAATAACAQWNFTLDTAFRTQITQQNVNAIHVLPGTGIYLSGRVRFPGDMSDRALSLVDEAGEQVVSFPFSWGGGKMVPWTNKLYIQNGNLIRRMNLDGTIDLSFVSQSGGSGSAPYISLPTNGDFHVFPDGRVLLSGSYALSDAAHGFVGQYRLVWLTNTGYLDTTRVHRNANGPIWEFKELPNGQFICTCNCSVYEGQPVSKLFKVNADLTLDTSFQPGVNWGNIFAYHGLPDGRVYAAGRYKRAVAPNDTLYLARFMPDGALDPSFTPPSIEMGSLNADYGPGISCLLPWSDQYVIAAGEFGSVNQQPRTSMFMVDSSGSLTTAFQDMHIGIYEGQFGNSAEITSIVPVNTDTLYICGAYVGVDEGTVNDTLQRFVSRLLVSDITTVAEEASPSSSFMIHPNPAQMSVTISYYPVHGTGGIGRILVLDIAGRIVAEMSMNTGQGQTVWDTRHTAPGTYLVQYVWNGRIAHSEKLILQQ